MAFYQNAGVQMYRRSVAKEKRMLARLLLLFRLGLKSHDAGEITHARPTLNTRGTAPFFIVTRRSLFSVTKQFTPLILRNPLDCSSPLAQWVVCSLQGNTYTEKNERKRPRITIDPKSFAVRRRTARHLRVQSTVSCNKEVSPTPSPFLGARWIDYIGQGLNTLSVHLGRLHLLL